MERELQAPVDLCDANGRLNPDAVGWSRQPLHRCNLSGRAGRKKRWNYWAVTSPDHLFSVTLADIDYLGLAFVYYLDFTTGWLAELTVSRLFGYGCSLNETVPGDLRFEDRRLKLRLTDDGVQIRLWVEAPEFHGCSLSADLQIARPPGHETLNVVIPWSERHFQYTSKQEALPAHGQVMLDSRVIPFPQGASWACLDFGRGVWPYRTSWNWAAAAGMVDGRSVGFNLGGKWTDGTGYTENGIVVDGRLTKIGGAMTFRYDAQEFKNPWQITGERVDLTFLPFYERVAKTDILLLRSEVHQLIGRFSGVLETEDGERIAIRNMIGWAEEHRARW